MSKKNDWKSPADYLIEAYTNKLINDYREDDEKERQRQQQKALTNNTTNSSTTPQKSSYGAQTVSNEPSTVSKQFESTARKYTNSTANDSIRRNSRGQTVSGRDRTRSAVNSPNVSAPKVKAKEDTGKWLGSEFMGGISRGNEAVTQSIVDNAHVINRAVQNPIISRLADNMLPNNAAAAIKLAGAFGDSDLMHKIRDYYAGANKEQQKKAEDLRGDSWLREKAGNITQIVSEQLPMLLYSTVGGVGNGVQAFGKKIATSLIDPKTLTTYGNYITRALLQTGSNTAENPYFWDTFLRTFGPAYEEEKGTGASDLQAMVSAATNAYAQSAIEIGSGFETSELKNGFLNNLKEVIKSSGEEGAEEIEQEIVDKLTRKALGTGQVRGAFGAPFNIDWTSMNSEEARNAKNIGEWLEAQRGMPAVFNPATLLEQGAYGALAGGLMTGSKLAGTEAVNSIRNDNYRNAHPDFEEHAKDLIQRASVQGREGEMSTRAQNLAEEVSEQMARGQQPTAYQMRELESAVATDEYYNQKAYENSSQERYNQAVEEGKADTVQQTGSADEYYGFTRGLNETEQRNYDKAKAVMGKNASENSVLAVSKLMTGSESNRDIDTILLDPEARSAVEELAEVTLPINNVKARAELENIALVNQIANRDKILEQTHKDIRTNMSRRGGELFDDNYDEAVKTLDVPNAAEIYENFFSRFYTAGTVEDADFEKTYNRIISPLVEDFGEDFGSRISQVFNHDFAQKVFAQGQIAMNSVRAKAQGRSLSVKASENPAGFTYEEEARKHISDREADLFTKLAERAKVHIRLVSSIAGGQANGSYDPETGVILIAADSDNKFITVFKHELTHHLKNTSPELYQKLEDFVFKKWYDGDPEKMEEKVHEYQRRYNMRPDQAREEIIADASEAFFTDEGAINEAVTFNEKMARAIHDGIKSLLDTFLDLVDTDRRADKGYGDFLKDLNILRDAEKMWLEALNESVGRSNGKAETESKAKGEVKHSLKDSDGKTLSKGQQDYFKDSKVRDDDGNLLVMYHGTNEDFTIFKANEFIGEQNGLSRIKGYFSTSKEYSNIYGHPEAYYLNIKNPLFIPDEWKTLKEWKKWFAKQGVKGIVFDSGIEEDSIKGYGYEDGTKGYALWDLFDSGNYWYGDGNLTEKIEAAGYDGIYWHEGEGWNIGNGKFIDGKPLAYMPFNENAIKRTDNLNPTEDKDIRYSLKEMDDAYSKAVDSNDTTTAERLVEQAAERAGYIPEKRYHGSLNASFTIFDKGHAHVGGNSGAGFYFSNNEEDSDINYADVNGADNQTKIDALFEMILDYGEWNGIEPKTPQEAYELAKAEIEKKPGIYEVYLKYDNPYVRDYRNSTNIYDKIMEDFDESVVDRDDYDNDDDYEDDLMNYREEHLFSAIDQAVLGAYSDIEDNYEVVDWPALSDISQALFEKAYEYGLTWSNITDVLDNLSMDSEFVLTNDGWGYEPDGSREFARAIIENFGYDAIIDKEAGTKFNQLKGRGMTDTEHTIVFHPNQIKSADAITRDNDGNVIPLSQRFNPESNDIRFSIKEKNEIENIGGAVTEGGTVAKYSLKSWNETDKKKLLQNLTEAGFTDKEAKKWIKQVNSVAAIIYGDMARLDYEADEYQDALKPNSEYFYTLDLSTLCAKRRLYQGTYNAIMKRMPDRAMMPEDTIRLRRMMADMRHEVPCGICYEESRKKNEGKFADVWLNGQSDKDWNQKLKEYNKKLENYRKKLDQYNALENKGKKKPPKAPERPERWLGYANMEHEDPYIPTLADVTTTTGRKALRENHPEALEAYLEYQKGRGSANPKVSFTHTDYRGDIMRMTATDIENVKHIGGLRIQSFSDFETVHVIDMMQAVMDMASRKLTSQAYTKVPAFADIFGGTGIKINLSLIGMVKNGKLVFDSVEGIDPKEAFRLRKKYSKNVGTIIVGANVESILAAWKDPRIDMVIPFHRSGWSTEEFEQLGLGDYKDFQEYQTERYLDGSSPNGISLADAKMQEIYSEDYWDYNKTGKENAEAYLELCAKKHYRPVFYNFLHDNGDGTWSLQEDGSTDGYWKSLVDYKMYDNDGNGAPQTEVRPIFDMRAARKVMDKFDGDPNTLPIAQDVVDRFVKEYKDTKYSLKSGGESRNYQNTISKLENQVKDLKAEFKRTDLKTADPKDVRIQAGKLIKRHDSNMSVQGELVDTFNRIFKLYKENGTDSFDDIYEIAKSAAVEVVNNISIVHDEGAEDYKAIKEYLKETPIVITEDMKKNITDFNDFRKRYFGKLKLVNGTTGNIDNVYMELNEMFPGQFTEDYVNPADQLYHMADVLDNYAPYYETLDGASPEMQDYVVDIAADIMETAYGLQTKKTFADKKYEEKVKAVAKARQKALESRDSALNRQKQRYEKKTEDLKAHNQEMRANRKARREDSEARTKLLKIARRLDRFKTTAAKREQIDALIGDLDLVAKGMTDKTLENLHDLRDWYSDRKETDPDFIADSNIEKKLERLSKKHIKDMDLADVRELYDVLSNIENELKTERKLINSEMRKDIKEAGRETIRNINNSKGLAMKTRGFDRFFINGTLSPLRQIRRVTGYNDNDPLYIATKELADGQRKMLDYQMTSWKAFDRFMKNKDFLRSINGPKAKEIEITGIKDGKQYKTKITPDIRMAMYLASMNADNLRHMRDGGVKLPDIKLYKKGKISEAMEKGTIVKFSPSMLNEITSHMTKTERAFAQEAYKYYNETSPEAINKVSEELKGYSIARVQNYYPIHTDSNFLSKEFEAMKFDGTIEGMGFLKERVRASNPIQMTGLVDELTRSIEMNSKYVGLAIPVRNFGKIYGVNDVTYTEREEGGVKTLEADYRGSVKDSISDKWGGAVASYIEKFMTDLQNGRKNYDDWGNFFSKLRSNYAGAVLTLNASVALKQAASYPTAAAVLGRAPLAKAMGNFGKVDLDLIAKYTPLQWYRSQGFSTTELGDIRSGNKQSLLNKYPFLNWIQGIDLATTRKLWKASEYYVQDHNKNLKKGTDEYYKAVADIYNRVIEETQPNYTTMQRPGLLRSDNDIVLALNMFKTQPYQNFNILYDSIGNYVAKRNQYNKVKNADTKKALQDAGRDMRNAIDSQIMQLAVFAAMTSLWALFRRKDDKYRDKEGNLTFVSYLERLAKDMLANSFAVVPFGSDIYGTVSSSITGEYYYGFSSVTDSSITDLLDTFTKGYKTIGEWVQYAMNDDPEKEKPDGDMYKDIVSVSESASRFLGAPFSNMKNLATGIYGWVAISKDGEYIGTYEALKMSFAKDTEKKELLMKAYRNDSKAYEELRKMMIEDGFKEDSLDYYIRKQTRENPDESSQTRYQEMVTYLEGSPMLWTNNDSSYKEAYDKVLRDIALGIETSTTESYTKYEGIGLKPEELVLVKLAMEKADQMYGNKNGYLDTDEKEKGLGMLAHLHLTEKEKEAIKKIKFNFDKKG